jgi:hypothetical protein
LASETLKKELRKLVQKRRKILETRDETITGEDGIDGDVMFTVHDPWRYEKILLVKDDKPWLKNHVVIPVREAGDGGDPLFMAMKPASGQNWDELFDTLEKNGAYRDRGKKPDHSR